MPTQQPCHREPLTHTGLPALFSPEHNAYLEEAYSWEPGSVLALYQSSSKLYALAQSLIAYAVEHMDPPDYEDLPPPPTYVSEATNTRGLHLVIDRYSPGLREQQELGNALPENWDLGRVRSRDMPEEFCGLLHGTDSSSQDSGGEESSEEDSEDDDADGIASIRLATPSDEARSTPTVESTRESQQNDDVDIEQPPDLQKLCHLEAKIRPRSCIRFSRLVDRPGVLRRHTAEPPTKGWKWPT